MGSSPQVPTVPDPNTVAAGQQQYNNTAGQSSQAGSMVNQNTAYGGLNYSQTGTGVNGTPIYTATTSFNPTQQALLDTLNGTKQTAGTAASNILQNANYGAGGTNISDIIGNSATGLTKDAMGKQVAYLNPFFQQQTDQLDAKLRNQGFAPGEKGYDDAMNAAKQSQAQTVTGFESTIEPQMWQQAMQSYMLPGQFAGTLANFGSPTAPTFQQTPQLSINPADLTGATSSANAANMAAYNAKLGANSSMLSGAMGIPTAILGGMAKNGSFSGLGGSLSSLLGAGGLGADVSAPAMAGLTDALGAAAII